MPISALRHVEVDYKLPVAKISLKLIELASEAAGDEAAFPVPEQLEIETNIALEGKALRAGALKLGEFSPFTCPECHGTLTSLKAQADKARERSETIRRIATEHGSLTRNVGGHRESYTDTGRAKRA